MSIDSAQFVWPASFACTLISENKVVPNSYTINVSIMPTDNVIGSISLGYKKLKYFVDNQLHNSIFIFEKNPLLGQLEKVESNKVLFPTEPYDYFVGSVLLNKFLKITEKYFHIDMISIDSALGDHINYSIIHPEECGLDLQGDYWWNRDSVDTTGQDKDVSWGDLEQQTCPKFEPKIIKGGRSED